QLMKLQLTTEHFWKLHQLVLLSKRYPTLEPYILSALQGLRKNALELLNELSRGRYPEQYPHLLTGAVYGAVMPMLDGSLNVLPPGISASDSADAVTFDHYLDTMCGYLRSGF